MVRTKKFADLSIEEQDKSKTVKFYVNTEKKTIACVIYDRMYDTNYTGVSHCHDCDTFDERKGRAIAFNKARAKEMAANIKYAMKEINEINAAYNKLVKRLEKSIKINTKYLKETIDDLQDLMR